MQSVKAVIMLNKEKVFSAEIKAMLPFVFHHRHVADKTQGGRH